VKLERQIIGLDKLAADFATEAGLIKQVGHPVEDWPLVIFKELADNALDAIEAKGDAAPVLRVQIDAASITVADNGPGIPPELVKRIATDFRTGYSDKREYISPTRGAQGNALATLLAMGYVRTGKPATTIIESQGVRHSITFTADPLTNIPSITYEVRPCSVKSGTVVTVWARSRPAFVQNRFLPFMRAYALCNPHLAVTVVCYGVTVLDIEPVKVDQRKWSASDLHVAHWYDHETFANFIRGRIVAGSGDKTVRDFIAEFRGQRGTQKRSEILVDVGASRMTLARFYNEGRNTKKVNRLLDLMQNETSETKPRDLGVIGKVALCERFAERGIAEEDFRYVPCIGSRDGVPYVVEVAFGWYTGKPEDIEDIGRELVCGVNFSAAISNPFKLLGLHANNWSRSLDDVLNECKAGPDEPVVAFVHLVCPVLNFTDKGKGTLVLGERLVTEGGDDDSTELIEGSWLDRDMGRAIIAAVTKATKKWTKARKAEEKNPSLKAARDTRMHRSKRGDVKDAAYRVMADAYQKVAGPNNLPALARQIMYAARGPIQDMTGSTLSDQYFTQTVLPAYLRDNPEETADWNVVYDERGSLIEPHSKHEFGIGTINVDQYLADIGEPTIEPGHFAGAEVKTLGPNGNYGGLLYIEKEGFLPLLDEVELADRHDLAVMSNKGFSVTAARKLVERLCHKRGIPLFILHDFDKAGFGIKATLHRDTVRYQFKSEVQAFDFGLRLDDVRALGIEHLSEAAADEDAKREARSANLRGNGATKEEIAFLLDKRVELNALTSDQFVAFVEGKLLAHGVRKIIPAPAMLADVFKAQDRSAQVADIVKQAMASAAITETTPPDNIDAQVAELLKQNPTWRWDQAVAEIVKRMRESEKV
jgi:hypothetical protein